MYPSTTSTRPVLREAAAARDALGALARMLRDPSVPALDRLAAAGRADITAMLGAFPLRDPLSRSAWYPVLVLPSSSELDAARLVLAVFIGLVGFAVARGGGASVMRSVLYGVGIGLGVLLPTLAVVVYLATAVYLGIPGGTVRRHLRRRHAT